MVHNQEHAFNHEVINDCIIIQFQFGVYVKSYFLSFWIKLHLLAIIVKIYLVSINLHCFFKNLILHLKVQAHDQQEHEVFEF